MSSRYASSLSSSSAYFRSGSESGPSSSAPLNRRMPPHHVSGGSAVDTRSRRYTPSVASTRPNTAYSTVSSTTARRRAAPGRKARTGTASSILGLGEQHNVVCALAEARGVTPSVGVSLINVSLGEVILSQICDNQSYVKTIHKMQMASPSRILFMNTACPPVKASVLFSLVEELIPEAIVDSFDRSAWSENAGLDFIHTLAFPSDLEPIKVALQGKFYAVCCFAAVSWCISHSK